MNKNVHSPLILRRIAALLAIASIAFTSSSLLTDVAHARRGEPRRKRKITQVQPPRNVDRADKQKIKVGWGGCSGCGE